MLKLKIVSPEKVVYDGEAESVVVPGLLGQFEILNNHAPIISSLTSGTVTYTNREGKQSINVRGGFVEMKKNEVCICVEV
jgi:F-type H+-transporting ATPase subunit epsilon